VATVGRIQEHHVRAAASLNTSPEMNEEMEAEFQKVMKETREALRYPRQYCREISGDFTRKR